ncbi:hypothetical protein SASPL_127131 [Salvia splendens]|uniref:Polygalacturonase n=1 Tax=Salvia splendens TaxID=180675 RepID=A0A8X8XK27_SALSN|nr:hypothetical protein SASPL_127131 [Salvia splendens]
MSTRSNGKTLEIMYEFYTKLNELSLLIVTGIPQFEQHKHQWINLHKQPNVPHRHPRLPRHESPNTDGIHIGLSSGVSVTNSRIATGDDCISMSPGTSNVFVQNVAGGLGHGISIGSHGWALNEAGVENVTVKSCVLSGTQNGVRIKTWARPSNGFVRNVHYEVEDLTMVNVINPIIIDQNYCPNTKNCPNQVYTYH